MVNDIPFAETECQGGVIAGPVREPRNLEQEIKGSIHDDATAVELGRSLGQNVPDEIQVVAVQIEDVRTLGERGYLF